MLPSYKLSEFLSKEKQKELCWLDLWLVFQDLSVFIFNIQLISDDGSLLNPHFTPYDPTQEPIFPPELSLNHAKYSSTSIQFGKIIAVGNLNT